MFGRPQDVDFKGALTEGTKKVGFYSSTIAFRAADIHQSPTSAYMLPTTPPLTILPFHLMDKLKSVPESELSADQEIHRRALGQYTDLGTPIPALWDALKVDLTRHVRDLVPQLQKAAEYAFELHIAKERSAVREDGWIEVNGFVLIKRVVTVLNAVAFVGPKLAYDERWQKLAFGYSDDLRDAFDSLLRCPNWLRPFAHRFILRQIGFDRRRRLAVDLLTPLMQNIEGETTNLIGWIRKRLSHTQADDTMFMARMQLRAALASADSVSQALTNTIWDLATMVEYLPPIVEEIEQCVAQTTNGVWDMSTIDGMSKIDSLLREVGRVHSPFLGECLKIDVQVYPTHGSRDANMFSGQRANHYVTSEARRRQHSAKRHKRLLRFVQPTPLIQRASRHRRFGLRCIPLQ